MANTIAIAAPVPSQTVPTTFQYSGPYHFDEGKGHNPQVWVELQIPSVGYDSGKVAATSVSPVNLQTGAGTWSYTSNATAGTPAKFQVWLYDGTTLLQGPISVSPFTVSNG